MTLVGPADGHFELLRSRYPDAEIAALPDGAKILTVRSIPLPRGWNSPHSDIRVIIPVGYPLAAPDCFYADASLRLSDGRLPKNSALQKVPQVDEPSLWFSWHIVGWNPSRDDFLKAVCTIRRRFDTAE